MSTGFIYDESFFWHNTGNGALFQPAGGWIETDVHAENPETKRRVKNLLERSGMMRKLESIYPRDASQSELELFHTPEYISKVKELSDTTGGDAGDLGLVGLGSFEIARLSAGAAITGVEAVMEGKVDNAYCLTRPPGHHAESDRGRGFCLFNNVVIAAEHAKKKYGLKKVMILDWDVHHGNGTESAFYSDRDTLFFSIHQEGNYPIDRGYVTDVGEGEGQGYTVNIPLPAGSADAVYTYAFENLITPIAEEFKPELILISAGQDASAFDPLARMMVTSEGYKKMADIVVGLANELCNGRLVVCHEGGYSAPYVPFCSLRIIESMSGIDSGVEDPFYRGVEGFPVNDLLTHQKEAVDEAIDVHSKYWSYNK